MASDTTSDAPPDDLVDENLIPSALSFPVVGLGASAGGLQALRTFFEQLPSDSGMAFVVVLHLSPKHASNLHTILQASTKMPCVQVTKPMCIEANHVYVIPPTKHLAMNDSYLRVTDLERPRGRHVAIDLFFRTLATVHRDKSMGIVLSGAGSDGAVGIAAIKEHGGVTLAQSPDDAEVDSMPRAAIAAGVIDWVMPVAEMPQKLVDMWANMRRIHLPGIDEAVANPPVGKADNSRDAEDALREIMVHLRMRTGHDFRHYKRATVLRRLERRLQVNGMPDLPSYRNYLYEKPEEPQALLKDLLIGVTNFFRDREAFESLEREVVPTLFSGDAGREEGLRVWTTGCATGEEAYSITMLLCEHAAQVAQPPEIQVFSTDIDERAIAVGRLGIYPESILTDVAPVRLRHFFDKENGHYRIRKEVREKVLFAVHNILRDPPFSKLDLISCRNLLIYLDREVHPDVLEMFHFALRPGGYLFLGGSESADAASTLFSIVDKKNRIYKANPVARSPRYAPPLPLGMVPAKQMNGPQAPVEKRRVSFSEIHQRLAEQYAPPSVLIDADGNIVHLSEQAGRFLRQPGGAPSHHLLSLVQPELRLELRTALFQAMQSGKSVEARRVKVPGDGRTGYINMIVRPLYEPAVNGQVVLVLFDEVEDSMGSDARRPGEDGQDPLVLQLEAELRRTKEQLQTTIEQSETSTEELKASNEELQAINEELRSTTEELETSKEELQSINEELITVNHELKMKVEETGKINDDLQNLIASTDIATVFIDRGMLIKRYTPRATQIFNIIPGDVGRSLLDIKHKVDYEELADDSAEAFQALRVTEREVRSTEGQWFLVRVLPYRTNEDRIDGAVLTFVDITGRRQAEERLRAGEERMRLVAESTKDHAIITMDLEGLITTWNKGAERVFGYADEEVIGKSSAILFVPEDREAGMPQLEMRRARENGRAEDDRWHLRKDGSRFFCSGVTTPLYRDEALQGYAKIARDLTGSKRLENEREARLLAERAIREQAQAASESKDEFLAIMSHELKNPLNLIQLNAELISHLPEARGLPNVAKAVGTIRKTVVTQAKIIDDLLDLSRITTGKLALELGSVDWCDAIERITSAMADDAQRKGVALQLDLWPEPVVVRADSVRVEQIVWNLVSNAIKFTPSGGQVQVRLTCDQQFGRLDVIDTGRGIPAEFLPRVFDMFEQVESRTTRSQGGLGIGLALVKQLTGLHGGRVDVQSEGMGHGTTFSVWLPLDSALAATPSKQALSAETLLKGLRVLAVDDDLPSLEAFLALLSLHGADVTAASHVEQALALIGEQPFDLAVSDIAMPGMDGYELARRLRTMPEGAAMSAIAVTGFGRQADVQRALASGFDAHLSKPLSLDQFLSVLQSIPALRQRLGQA